MRLDLIKNMLFLWWLKMNIRNSWWSSWWVKRSDSSRDDETAFSLAQAICLFSVSARLHPFVDWSHSLRLSHLLKLLSSQSSQMVVAHLANVGYFYEDTLQNDSGVIPVAVVFWQYVGVSENSVPLNPMVLMIIIPIKWLFHWEYSQHFQTNPYVHSLFEVPPSSHHWSLPSGNQPWLESPHKLFDDLTIFERPVFSMGIYVCAMFDYWMVN